MSTRNRISDGESIQAVEENADRLAEAGWAVAHRESGSCKVVIDDARLGEPDTIAIQEGIALFGANSGPISISRQTLTIPPEPSASPRKDLIALDPSGEATRIEGDQEPKHPQNHELATSRRPAPPSLVDRDLTPLAIVLVRPDDDDLRSQDIIDLRASADRERYDIDVWGDLNVAGEIIESGDEVATRPWTIENFASRDTIRAIDYGADPLGDASSAQALQEAINAADLGDRVVWGESGTYYLDAEISCSKPIELDLFEGQIESDYHDEQAHPNDQDHYMPLFRFHGSIGANVSLTGATERGSDQVHVENPGNFQEGEYVILRPSTPDRGDVPGFDYYATQSRIREIENGVIYLEDEALWDYSTDDYLTHADYLTRPILRNIHIIPRHDPEFDAEKGKVLGGPRHCIATEFTENALIENCTARGYDSHLWSSRDDINPSLDDCTARKPMNLSGSCGEPVHIESSRDVSVIRPAIKGARRAIDARSGCGDIYIEQPDITGVSFIGISWHSTSDVASDIEVQGGHVSARPTDPTMDNKDGSNEDERWELQSGRPINSSSIGTLTAYNTDFVGRSDCIINGEATIEGGSIYKFRSAGSVITLNGSDIVIDGTNISSSGSVSRLVGTDSDTNAEQCELKNVTLDASGSPNTAVEILGGSDISVSGEVTDGTTMAVSVESGTNIGFDLDTHATGDYAYAIYSGSDIDIEGRVTGSCSNEVIYVEGGSDIDIDANIQASGGEGVRGVRLLGGSLIDITGSYEGPGLGIMFSGGATGVSIHNMRINVTSSNHSGAVGSGSGISGLNIIRWRNNDIRGQSDGITFNSPVDGLWAVNNICGDVSYPDETNVGQIYGNGKDAPEVITTDHTDASNPHDVGLEQSRSSNNTFDGPVSFGGTFTFDTADSDFILRANGVDLLRQPESGPIQMIQGADIGPTEAPPDSLTQLINASSTSSAVSGDRVGYTFALNSQTVVSVEGVADGSGGVSDITFSFHSENGKVAEIDNSGNLSITGTITENTSL